MDDPAGVREVERQTDGGQRLEQAVARKGGVIFGVAAAFAFSVVSSV